MGNISDDMRRLRGDVDALRGERDAMIQGLARGAKDLATSVSAMRADLADAHTAMAKKSRRDRASYLSGVKKRVSKMRKENSADLAGARRAWFGKAN